MTTSTRVVMEVGVDGFDMQADSTVSVTDIHPACVEQGVMEGTTTDRKYASLEPDFWLLDGTYKFIPSTPDSIDVGIMSASLSGADTNFSASPDVTITFGQDYDFFTGLLLKFSTLSGGYCDAVTLVFKNSVGTTISTQNFNPDGYEYFCEISGTLLNVRSVVIQPTSMSSAYRRFRLLQVVTDAIQFRSDEIKEAILVEEISPLAVRLPSNTFEFTVWSDTPDFNIIDPQGVYASLVESLGVDIFESVDGVEEYMGRQYLESWEVISDNEIRLKCVDALAMMKATTFQGKMYDGVGFAYILGETFISNIMASAGFDYTLDASLEGYQLLGVARTASHWETLRTACMAIGAYATCSRSAVVQVRPMEYGSVASVDQYLPLSQIAMNARPELRPAVSKTEIETHSYFVVTVDAVPIFKGALTGSGLGTDYILNWKELVYSITEGSGSTIHFPTDYEFLEGGPDWSKIRVYTSGTLELLGSPWQISKRLFSQYYSAPAIENVVRVEDAEMIDHSFGSWKALAMYDYYAHRHVANVKVFAKSVPVGECVVVETNVAGKFIRGIVEQVTANLAGGYVSDLRIVGTLYSPMVAGTKYNNTSSQIAYYLFTSSDSNVLHYDGDIRISPNGSAGQAGFSFVGSQFKVIYRQNTGGGEATVTVTVNGDVVGTIDQNGASVVYQKEWTSPDLGEGHYFVSLTKVGTTGAMNIDAIEIL